MSKIIGLYHYVKREIFWSRASPVSRLFSIALLESAEIAMSTRDGGGYVVFSERNVEDVGGRLWASVEEYSDIDGEDAFLESILDQLERESYFLLLRPEERESNGGAGFIGTPRDIRNLLWEVRPDYDRKDGYVYLAIIKKLDKYKIGRSKTPQKRIKHFDTKMPVKVDQVSTIRADNDRVAENILHEACESEGWRVNGEWFELPEEVVSAFCDAKSFFRGKFYSTKSFVESPWKEVPLLKVISDEVDYKSYKEEEDNMPF